MIKKINHEEARVLLDTVPNVKMFDVREEEEYLLGHAKEAELYPLSTINEETAQEMIPSKETPIILYCRSGNRSNMAAVLLSGMGYKCIYDLGSLLGWKYGLDY